MRIAKTRAAFYNTSRSKPSRKASLKSSGGPVYRNGHLARVVQQVDATRPPLTIEQHTSPEYWCAQCPRGFKAPMPAHIERGGLVGLELTALDAPECGPAPVHPPPGLASTPGVRSRHTTVPIPHK
jgi:hypothetical protein